MQIKMANWMQNMNHTNAKVSGTRMSGTKSNQITGTKRNTTENSMLKAASVDLSKSGRYKARMLKESERKSSADDVMQTAESTINDIIDTVQNGGRLTKDQERIFNEGMKDLASKHYKDMKAQSANERAQELQYAKYLDRDYKQIMELLD